MPASRRALLDLLAPLGTTLILAVATLTVGTGEAIADDHLPDLEQALPTGLVLTGAGPARHPTWRLGFRSAVGNVGDGPLIIDGRRPTLGRPTMTAVQVIVRDPAPEAVVPAVGRLRYVRTPDHQHWHLLGFDRYELRRARGGQAVVRDRKSGFCLGDRYALAGRALPGRAPQPVYTGRCGLGEPDRLTIREGISVGYGDDYKANLEGQWLPLNGLRAGRYLLVHRANADHRLRERSYANNASSLLLRLRWRRRLPEVDVLASCPDTARCRRPASPRVQTLATGLEIPWEIAFLPGGRALVTERPGRVRLLSRGGRLRRDPVARVPVSASGEGGLLGLAVDPQFRANRLVYLYYTTVGGMRLERWRFTRSHLVRETGLVAGIAAGRLHDSGRIAFGPDGRLYVSTGDAADGELAQDPSSLNGKMLALTAAQYRGSGPVVPEIVAMGLRNSQGFDWQPITGRLIATEHGPTGFDGPQGYDEVNEIVPGGNYGWPVVFGAATEGGRFIAPLRVYVEAIAPSGATFVTRPGSKWTGDYLIAALRGEQLRRLVLRDGRVVRDQPLLTGRFGRLRTVVEGPDGDLYVLTSNRDGRGRPTAGDDRILRVIPPRG